MKSVPATGARVARRCATRCSRSVLVSVAGAMIRRNTQTARSAAATTREGVRGRVVLYGFTFLYASILIAAAAANYLLYLAPRYDLGNMVQAVWSTSHGHFMQMSG